jgi:hypothetical protein
LGAASQATSASLASQTGSAGTQQADGTASVVSPSRLAAS